jgi:hypothetical protein
MILEHRLTQPVAFAGGAGAVIGGAVAFDAEQVAVSFFRVGDRKVDEEASNPDLRMHLNCDEASGGSKRF